MTNTIEQHFQFENPEQEIGLVGPQDAHLKLLEEGLGVQITGMGAQLTIIGSEDAVAQTIAVVEELYLLIKKASELDLLILFQQ
ncbi:Uncharacterised protein [Weissella viridescens]|uniref:Phosphate starvation-inducible protein PhoH n=1 Tax=Weissella viridescens TaxID=1629 RepID=A0A380P7Z2_WEIVI|nr:Uncharacterised protein [Weissella viridescens]